MFLEEYGIDYNKDGEPAMLTREPKGYTTQ